MRLTTDTIHQILKAVSDGEARSAIAERFSVDPATVRYHVEQFENVYGSTSAVYSIIRPVQRACTHPSMKCLICGKAHDAIHRRELEEIRHLKRAFAEASSTLVQLGYEPPKVSGV